MNEKKEKKNYWNTFCEQNSQYRKALDDLLKSHDDRKDIEKEIKDILKQDQGSQSDFVKQLFCNLPMDEIIWYLERGTNLAGMLQDSIEQRFPFQFTDIKPLWAKSIILFYEQKDEFIRQIQESENAKKDADSEISRLNNILLESINVKEEVYAKSSKINDFMSSLIKDNYWSRLCSSHTVGTESDTIKDTIIANRQVIQKLEPFARFQQAQKIAVNLRAKHKREFEDIKNIKQSVSEVLCDIDNEDYNFSIKDREALIYLSGEPAIYYDKPNGRSPVLSVLPDRSVLFFGAPSVVGEIVDEGKNETVEPGPWITEYLNQTVA